MDVGVMKQRLRPRVDDREEANVGAEMLGLAASSRSVSEAARKRIE